MGVNAAVRLLLLQARALRRKAEPLVNWAASSDPVARGERDGATTKLDVDLETRSRCRRCQLHRDELRPGRDRRFALPSFAPPLVDQVRVQAVRERDACHRGTGLLALVEHLRLQFGIVAPSRDRLGVAHGVHLDSLGGHHRRRADGQSQDRSAGRLRISGIIGVTDGIAFQTKILALNAAV